MADTQVKQVYRSIVEGRAVLRLTSDKVFYNPVQEFNRDLSIAVLTVFINDYKKEIFLKTAEKTNHGNNDDFLEDDKRNKEITILEALSATGLRSIRYAKEVIDVTKIIANDISEKAVETIQSNLVFNNVDHIVETSQEDACILMYKHKHRIKRFTAVDLDPYGSPSVFLDAAVQSVADGGLLLVTATDMAVLAGNVPSTCYSKYGAISVRTKCCHEMALRILLQSIEAHANRYCRYIVPMLCVSADFYIRVFVKVYSGASQCKNSTSKLSLVYHCVGCDTATMQPLVGYRVIPRTKKNPNPPRPEMPKVPAVGEHCENCNQRHQMCGPVWSAPIHDEAFVSRVLTLVQRTPSQFGTAKRMEGMLSVVREELSDAPLYYTLDRLCGTIHSEMMPILTFRSALLNAGYKVSYSHANKLSIKTNAPMKFVWDIMRKWTSLQPVKPAKAEANPIAKYILSRPITYEVDLSDHPDANPDSRRDKHTRFQFNPTANWGPGSRSTVNTEDVLRLKAKRNQNKRSRRRGKHAKRQLSPAEGSNACKRTNRHQQHEGYDDTEPGYDIRMEPPEYSSDNTTKTDTDAPSVGANVADEAALSQHVTSTDQCNADIGPATSVAKNGTAQSDVDCTSDEPADAKK